MGAILTAVVSSAASTYVSRVVGSKLIGALAGMVISGIIGSALTSKPTVGDFDITAKNILTNKKANNAPIPVIYGTRRVGGVIVFLSVSDDHLFINLVVSEGEIDSYIRFYFNDELTTEKHEPYNIDKFIGTDEQEANIRLIDNFDYYTPAHRLAGTAYITVDLTYNAEVYPSGAPLIHALVKGVKVYDPRTGLIAWSDNPILCLRDYLIKERYGRSIDPLLIDDVSFIVAANYCDEEVMYNNDNAIKRYTCNGVVETQVSSLAIIKNLLSACRGILIFSAGKYKVIIDKPEIANFTFSEDNIIGGWKINLGGKKSQFNRMRANFFNSLKNYQADIAVVDKPSFRVLDGGNVLDKMIDLPFNTDIIRATAITAINLNQSRYTVTCEFTSTIEALRVEVGDVVYINHKTPGWHTHNSNLGKKFRITQIILQSSDEVKIVANEYADEVYEVGDLNISESELVDSDDLLFCLPPSNLRVSHPEFWGSNPNGLTFLSIWDESPDAFLKEYEVGYRRLFYLSNWTYIKVGKVTNWSKWFSKGHGHPEIRVRAINTIGVASAWVE